MRRIMRFERRGAVYYFIFGEMCVDDGVFRIHDGGIVT